MKQLIAIHNLTATNLSHCLRMGGMAAPSIAITKVDTPLWKFGEITLVAPWALVDPQKGARIFAADIYSPRYPRIHVKVNHKKLLVLHERLRRIANHPGIEYLLSSTQLTSQGLEYLQSTPVILMAFLQSKGVQPQLVWKTVLSERAREDLLQDGFAPWMERTDYFELLDDPVFRSKAIARYKSILLKAGDVRIANHLDREPKFQHNVVSSLARSIISDAEQRRQPTIDVQPSLDLMRQQIHANDLDEEWDLFLQEMIESISDGEVIYRGMSASGRRLYSPHTLENVAKIMQKGVRGGEGFFYGMGSLRAMLAPEIKSLLRVEQMADRLVDKATFDAVKEHYESRLRDIAQHVRPNPDFGQLLQALSDTAIGSLERRLKTYGLSADTKTLHNLSQFLEQLRNMPTEYFEAKVLRPVKLSEFQAAIVPHTLPTKLFDALSQHIPRLTSYRKHDEQDRLRALHEVLHPEKDQGETECQPARMRA